jgi:23S rRNA pseudouridine1911/1915/1917 synthase
VHFSHIGHPILGDHLYGNRSELIDRQALHCKEMTLKPPRESDKISIVSDMPEDIKKVLDHLRSS